VLEAKSAEGYKVSVDVVSETSERFLRVVTPCLPHIDYLVFNEIEAGRSTGMEIRNPDGQIKVPNLKMAARRLLDGGVRELVAIHFPEGGFVMLAGGKEYYHPSFSVPEEEFRGAAGAGDAFCAGLLYGLHEGLELGYSLALANASARFNLTNPTCSDGAVSLDELERFLTSEPEQTPILDGLQDL
jgi:sugar/nucleoside kinase (ribokinase family)